MNDTGTYARVRTILLSRRLGLTLALCVALAGGGGVEVQAESPPPSPAGSGVTANSPEDALAPARRAARGKERPARAANDRDERLLLSLRLGLWPVWTVINWDDEHQVLPFVELSVGYKVRWFELGVHAGVALGEPFDIPGTVLGLGVSASFYSLRLESFRLRHGIAVGVVSDLLIRRRPPPVAALPMPTVRLNALDLFIRLGEGWWLEIAPLSFGWPAFYELALGIRYELSVD